MLNNQNQIVITRGETPRHRNAGMTEQMPNSELFRRTR
jgi:hypothetical protein